MFVSVYLKAPLAILRDRASGNKLINVKSIQSFLGALVAIWLSAGYILPNTVFSEYSAQTMVPWLSLKSISEVTKIGVNLTGLIAVTLIAWMTYEGKPQRVVLAILVLFISLLCASIVLSHTNNDLLSGSWLLLASVSCGLLAAWMCGSTRNTLMLMTAMVSLQAVYSVTYYLTGIDRFISGDVLRASGSYDGPSALYRVLVVALPISFSFAANTQTKYMRATWIFTTLIIAVALMLTWYRGGIVATTIALLYLTFQRKDHRNITILFGMFALLFVGATFSVRVHNQLDVRSSRRSIASRVDQVQVSWRKFVRHPVLGVGRGEAAIPIRIGTSTDAPVAMMPGPPNQVLFALVEGGIVEAAILITFFGSCVIIGVQMRSPVGWGVSASWISLAVCGLTDIAVGVGNSFFTPINCVVGMLIGATLIASRNEVRILGDEPKQTAAKHLFSK